MRLFCGAKVLFEVYHSFFSNFKSLSCQIPSLFYFSSFFYGTEKYTNIQRTMQPICWMQSHLKTRSNQMKLSLVCFLIEVSYFLLFMHCFLSVLMMTWFSEPLWLCLSVLTNKWTAYLSKRFIKCLLNSHLLLLRRLLFGFTRKVHDPLTLIPWYIDRKAQMTLDNCTKHKEDRNVTIFTKWRNQSQLSFPAVCTCCPETNTQNKFKLAILLHPVLGREVKTTKYSDHIIWEIWALLKS